MCSRFAAGGQCSKQHPLGFEAEATGREIEGQDRLRAIDGPACLAFATLFVEPEPKPPPLATGILDIHCRGSADVSKAKQKKVDQARSRSPAIVSTEMLSKSCRASGESRSKQKLHDK